MNGDSLTEKLLTNEEIIKSFTDVGHMDLLFFKLIEHLTHEAAYDAIECHHIKLFKARKYKNFDSYRIAKHRRQRKKSENS